MISLAKSLILLAESKRALGIITAISCLISFSLAGGLKVGGVASAQASRAQKGAIKKPQMGCENLCE
jgi:hypothetical protein